MRDPEVLAIDIKCGDLLKKTQNSGLSTCVVTYNERVSDKRASKFGILVLTEYGSPEETSFLTSVYAVLSV